MNDQDANSNTPAKRGPGRPRKVRPGVETPVVNPVATPVALPVDPLSTLVTDRAGAANILGVSVSTVKRLEKSDPDFPRPFAVGAQCDKHLISSIHAYVMKKARAAATA